MLCLSCLSGSWKLKTIVFVGYCANRNSSAALLEGRKTVYCSFFFAQDALSAAVVDSEWVELHSLINTLPIEQVHEMLAVCKNAKKK